MKVQYIRMWISVYQNPKLPEYNSPKTSEKRKNKLLKTKQSTEYRNAV